MTTAIVNGSERVLPDGTTVRDLIDELGVSGKRGVAVARNGDVLLRTQWDTTRVESGDRVEVLHAVQGG
ncbi:MAG: sulfur carrier protein ThiS [Candidatus Dormibacteraeota bacterium]|nr:sulfur carrier protein ThiS [Candidatus Dormibacteraeota bacterium]MBV9526155.1 sulfur carrier protein ThiS [Candidatus Dormibacteraeota bacterium]